MGRGSEFTHFFVDWLVSLLLSMFSLVFLCLIVFSFLEGGRGWYLTAVGLEGNKREITMSMCGFCLFKANQCLIAELTQKKGRLIMGAKVAIAMLCQKGSDCLERPSQKTRDPLKDTFSSGLHLCFVRGTIGTMGRTLIPTDFIRPDKTRPWPSECPRGLKPKRMAWSPAIWWCSGASYNLPSRQGERSESKPKPPISRITGCLTFARSKRTRSQPLNLSIRLHPLETSPNRKACAEKTKANTKLLTNSDAQWISMGKKGHFFLLVEFKGEPLPRERKQGRNPLG